MAESTTEPLEALGGDLPGFQFVDHVAIAVPRGSLDAQVAAYRMLGFREIHREEVGGKDQVREVLLQIGSGPNLIQLLEPPDENSTVHRAMHRNGAKGRLHHL